MQFFDPNLPPPGPPDSFQRKRSRDALDAEGDDCLPISKRINRLHIEHQATSWSSEEQAAFAGQAQGLSGNPESPPLQFPGNINGGHSPDVPHDNGQTPLSCDRAAMFQMYAGTDAGHQSGLHPFANEGLHSMPDLGGVVPHSPELIQGAGLQFGQPGVNAVPNGDLACQPQYQPEMNADENPHYYHINQVLYSAHWDRVHRFKNE